MINFTNPVSLELFWRCSIDFWGPKVIWKHVETIFGPKSTGRSHFGDNLRFAKWKHRETFLLYYSIYFGVTIADEVHKSTPEKSNFILFVNLGTGNFNWKFENVHLQHLQTLLRYCPLVWRYFEGVILPKGSNEYSKSLRYNPTITITL